MKYTYSEYRQKAWSSLEGKWGAAALVTFVYMLIAGAVSTLAGGDPTSWRTILLILTLALLPMEYVFATFFLRIAKGGDAPKVGELFNPYKTKESFCRTFLVQFWVGLFVFLWCLLLIVPGIIKAYAYSMAVYIAEENPELQPNEARKKSEELMKGHKWDLFVLDLTFLGWLLLGCLTAGILMFWIQPYINTAHAHFYLSLKGEEAPAEDTKVEVEVEVVEVIETEEAAQKTETYTDEKAGEPESGAKE